MGPLDADEVARHRPPSGEVEEGHLARDSGAAEHVLEDVVPDEESGGLGVLHHLLLVLVPLQEEEEEDEEEVI